MTVKADRSGSALGRGLASLIPQRHTERGRGRRRRRSRGSRPNPYQPAAAWTTPCSRSSPRASVSTACSSRSSSPRRSTATSSIAGERRVRAARLAGLERIPALVRQLADRDQLEVALVENVQRADLDPIDEATRVPPADRRVRAHAGTRRRAGREGARRRSPTRCGCSTSTRTSRPRSPTGGSARATGARSAASPSTARHTCWAPSSTRASPCARPRSSCAACASPDR